MEQNGYHLSHKKPVDVELYCHQPWDYVVTLCREAEESRKDFDNVVRNWKHFCIMILFKLIIMMRTWWNNRWLKYMI